MKGVLIVVLSVLVTLFSGGVCQVEDVKEVNNNVLGMDKCAFKAQLKSASGAALTVLDVDEVHACWRSVGLQIDVKTNTIDAVRQVLELYSYTDIYRDSGDPWNLQVLGSERLDEIFQTSFETDFEFHQAIRLLYNQYGDAHLTYRLPSPYGHFTFFRPFEFVMRGNGMSVIAVQKIFQRNYSSMAMLKDHEVPDLSRFLGLRLTAVNDVPVEEWLRDLTAQYGIYLDENARLNSILAGGELSSWTADSLPVPTSNMEKYTFENGESIDLPTIVVLLSASDFNREEFVKAMMPPLLQPNSVAGRQKPDIGGILHPHLVEHRWTFFHDTTVQKVKRNEKPRFPRFQLHEFYEKVYSRHRVLREEAIGPNTNDFTLMGASDNQVFVWWTYNDTTTGNLVQVWHISTFAPSGDSIDEFPFNSLLYSFVYEMDNALRFARDNNISQLLLDLTGNGGGYIGLAQRVAYLLGKGYDQEALPRYDLRRTPLADQVSRTAYEAPWLADDRTDQPLSEVFDDWYFNGPTRERGGVTSTFSNKFYHQNSTAIWISNTFDAEGNLLPLERVHFFDKILFLTDGRCGSACSQFSSQLNNFGYGEYVSYGGFRDPQMDTSAFAGGSVKEWNDLVVNNFFLLKTLPTSAMTRVNREEMFRGASEIPRQLEKIPARFYIPRWPVQGQYSFLPRVVNIVYPLYRQAISFFEQVIDIDIIVGEKSVAGREKPELDSENQKPAEKASSENSRQSSRNASRKKLDEGSLSSAAYLIPSTLVVLLVIFFM